MVQFTTVGCNFRPVYRQEISAGGAYPLSLVLGHLGKADRVVCWEMGAGYGVKFPVIRSAFRGVSRKSLGWGLTGITGAGRLLGKEAENVAQAMGCSLPLLGVFSEELVGKTALDFFYLITHGV